MYISGDISKLYAFSFTQEGNNKTPLTNFDLCQGHPRRLPITFDGSTVSRFIWRTESILPSYITNSTNLQGNFFQFK